MTFNEAPNALLWNAKLAQQYAKGYDSQGQPLQAPQAVVDVEKFVTNQVPSFTSGTMTSRATDLFVGDFRQLLVGQRLTFTVQTLTERDAELARSGSSPIGAATCSWRGPGLSRSTATAKELRGGGHRRPRSGAGHGARAPAAGTGQVSVRA